VFWAFLVHRCGRAGRTNNKPEAAASSPPTVYSFFTREFAPMADSVIELLKICKAQVDPNLLALSSEKAGDGKETKSNKRQKKQDKSQDDSSLKRTNPGDHVHEDQSEDDQFSYLGSNKIVLKRALHVSDAEDSDSD
jgi:superfamily II DNA/RNA helicase